MDINELRLRDGAGMDAIPYDSRIAPLIWVGDDGPLFAAGISGKRALLKHARDSGGVLLIAWPGQWRTDVFTVDLEIAAAQLGKG